MKNTRKNDSQDRISPALTAIEELEHRFSDVRGNAIMEELMTAAKEYITEKGGSDETS